LQFYRPMNTISLFIPLIATAFAFWFVGSEVDFKTWRVVASGIFVGLTGELSSTQCASPSFGYIANLTSRPHALHGVL
jgi:ABC-type transport system involved in multi-copper enzyme maturation permease subunit